MDRVTNIALAVALGADGHTVGMFTVENWILFVTVLFLFPVRGRVWMPHALGWWDSPFTQKIDWSVRGRERQDLWPLQRFHVSL